MRKKQRGDIFNRTSDKRGGVALGLGHGLGLGKLDTIVGTSPNHKLPSTHEFCSLPNINYSFPTEMTIIPMCKLTHAA